MPVETRRIFEAVLEGNVITHFAAKAVKKKHFPAKAVKITHFPAKAVKIILLAAKSTKTTHTDIRNRREIFKKSGTVDYSQLPERGEERKKKKRDR